MRSIWARAVAPGCQSPRRPTSRQLHGRWRRLCPEAALRIWDRPRLASSSSWDGKRGFELVHLLSVRVCKLLCPWPPLKGPLHMILTTVPACLWRSLSLSFVFGCGPLLRRSFATSPSRGQQTLPAGQLQLSPNPELLDFLAPQWGGARARARAHRRTVARIIFSRSSQL